MPESWAAGVPTFWVSIPFFFGNLFKEFIHLFIYRERGIEGKREGEKHQCAVASHVPLAGDLAHSPGMCPDWESNQPPFTLQAAAKAALAILTQSCHSLPFVQHSTPVPD